MKKTVVQATGFIFLLTLFLPRVSFCQNVPQQQTIGGVTKQEKDIERSRAIEKKAKTQATPAEQPIGGEPVVEDAGPTTQVSRITVEGATLLKPEEISAITAQYEGKALTMKGMQKVANLITDEYRKKGYATSRAYVPPQTIADGVLLIKVVEGKIGDVSIEGNKHFSTSMLKNKLGLTPDGYFDYSALQNSLVYINQSADRTARATLVPGKAPGTTDVVINVEDRLPVHVGFQYDNFASRYLNRNRYSGTLEHNNLLGFDDKLLLKYQRGDDSRLVLEQGRYLFPVDRTLEIGVYALTSKLRLGKEFTSLDARGTADIYGIFASKAVLQEDDMDVRLTGGFDYKRIRNYLAGDISSRDSVRLAKLGVDADINDPLGRNIVLPEVQMGIPDLFGGMPKKNYFMASRSGAGGDFTKGLLTYYRLQELPWETSLLWKNYGQFTNNKLVASEQFQIGGPASVRGYPVAEHSGDCGFYTSPELSLPLYGLNKEAKVPFSDATIYDTSRVVLFYDWGHAQYNDTVVAGEKKKQTLRGYGFGYRFTLKDNLTFRVEVGYPLGVTPSDGDHAHPWVEFTSKF